MQEKCGIFAATDLKLCQKMPSSTNIVPIIVEGLLNLQHRGQLSAGITTFSHQRPELLTTYKKNGLVNEVFQLSSKLEFQEISSKFEGGGGIGHVRYATSGCSNVDSAQPFEYRHGKLWNWFSFAFNGNIANYEELKSDFIERGYHLKHDIDTEILMYLLAQSFDKYSNFVDIFSELQEYIDGACNMVLINARGDLAVYRDQHGFHPLSYAVTNDNIFLVSSETNALIKQVTDIQDVVPGELLVVDGNSKNIKSHTIRPAINAHCSFEHIYFANVVSEVNGIPVYFTRLQLGKKMAEIEDQKLDNECIVVSIPDSSRPAGSEFARTLGLRHEEGIVRNQFVGRTFIEKDNREAKVIRKFSLIKNTLEGKRVFIVDDSLVRSTTLKTLIKVIRESCSPKEVHLRIASPPLFAPCYYGIDIPDEKQLFAAQSTDYTGVQNLTPEHLQKMAETLGADSLKYLPIESMIQSIGIETNKLCMACLNGQYPTLHGQKRYKNT